MRKNYITLHRFCSYKEYEQYMSGSSLHNHTNHYHGGKGGSLSRGFCFFMGDVDEWARRLNGLVDFDVLLTVKVAPELVRRSVGVYADWSKDDGHSMPPKKHFQEFCSETYSRDKFHYVSGLDTYSRSHISRSQVLAHLAKTMPQAIHKLYPFT